MNIIEEILGREEFKAAPPVLVDVGASSEIHAEWAAIAKYSICVAFDADEREMGYIVNETAGFKKLYIYNSIVTDDEAGEKDFHLAKFPQCSSVLEPDNEKLSKWAFGPYFDVEKTVRLKNRSLPSVLKELGISRVDWFKTDSQGIDMRLFSCMGETITGGVIAADFEPGIIDAYKGEDKLFALMAYMSKMPFWMSDMAVKGNYRISAAALSKLSGLEKRYMERFFKKTPGWAEVSFLNEMGNEKLMSKREYLLAWIFSTVKKQHGFAAEIASKGFERFGDRIFPRLGRRSMKYMMPGHLRILGFAAAEFFSRAIRKICHLAGKLAAKTGIFK